MIKDIFQKFNIRLTDGKQPVYPGCCSQCNMKNHGSKTMLFDLTPDMQIRICDRCYAVMRESVKNAITEAQNVTCFQEVMNKVSLTEELTIPHGLWYDHGWRIHPLYRVMCIRQSVVYVPVIKENETQFIRMRDLLFMNGKVP